jgi:Zn finger protein HypA/HybF involved in hydrogenase expression
MVEKFRCENCGTIVSESAYRIEGLCPTCGKAIAALDRRIKESKK